MFLFGNQTFSGFFKLYVSTYVFSIIIQPGLGNRPNASEAVNSEDEDELYDSGAFGQNNPDSLITTIWYMNTVHFGLRGSHEHRQLKWGDVKLESDQNGVQSLTYNERITKTRDGSNTKNTRAYGPKSWPNPNDERRCHIATYLILLATYCTLEWKFCNNFIFD
jgi:hypothetical protein